MNNFTRLLTAAGQGDAHAASQLLPLVYDELRKLAAQRLAQEKPGQTLDATALVHEAYVRLAKDSGNGEGDQPRRFAGPRHFFAVAAEAMRRILIENARRKRSQKRGGNPVRTDRDPDETAAPARSEELMAIDDAVDDLAAVNSLAAEVVKLRYFVGLSVADAAEVLGISPRSTDRAWAYARAWLRTALRDGANGRP
jgi:RNA polymerase sigma factor (TIGR02999 family)